MKSVIHFCLSSPGRARDGVAYGTDEAPQVLRGVVQAGQLAAVLGREAVC